MDNQSIISKVRIDHVKLPPQAQIPEHEQETWELTYIITGSGIRTIGDCSEAFSAGEILLIPPGIKHHWRFDESDTDEDGCISNIALFFYPSLLNDISEKIPDLRDVVSRITSRTEVVSFAGRHLNELRRLLHHIVKDAENEIKFIRFLQILAILSTDSNVVSKGKIRHLTKNQSKAEAIRIYCECNYMRPIGLADATAHTGMNTTSFCKFFRRNFGKSFIEYINHLRYEEVCRQLINTDKSVSSIAYDTGFTCIPYFNRLVRELSGMSPSDFRITRR